MSVLTILRAVHTVIIGGLSRAGKSRLAHKLFLQTKSTVIHMDIIASAVRNVYSNVLAAGEFEGLLQCDPAETVLVKVVRHVGKQFSYLRIFETCALSPAAIAVS